MVEQGGLRVASSIHAAERALQRVPALTGRSRSFASRWLELAASSALIEGRKARRIPRWCARINGGEYERGRVNDRGTQRFVWDYDETVAMLVHRLPDAKGGSAIWLIKTVMVPEPD